MMLSMCKKCGEYPTVSSRAYEGLGLFTIKCPCSMVTERAKTLKQAREMAKIHWQRLNKKQPKNKE